MTINGQAVIRAEYRDTWTHEYCTQAMNFGIGTAAAGIRFDITLERVRHAKLMLFFVCGARGTSSLSIASSPRRQTTELSSSAC